MSNRKTHGAPETPDAPAADGQEPVEQATGPESSERKPALEPPPDLGPVEAYHQRARLAEDRLAEVLTAFRKLKTDNEAHRERTTKNVERRFDQRRERLLLKFIDILDNMDRALEAAETTYTGEPMIEGLILVRTQLLQTLQEEGLERIPALGLPYDPSFAEAVETRPVDDPEHHHVVVKELLRAYRLNGRVARPARVVLGEYAEGQPRTPDATSAVTGEAEEDAPLAGLASEAPPSPDDSLKRQEPAATGEVESLEDIVSRAKAQEALFPDAFDDSEPPRDEEDD